ncbi:DUF4396 domain-containing protein [Acidisoma sp. 7E03]
MPPHWFQSLAAVYGPLSILGALAILADIVLLGRRQPMAIMNAVWPLTLLYWGPIGLLFYGWFGRPAAAGRQGHHHHERPMWQATFNGATHCGAGCALGDFLGDWLVVAAAFTLFGSDVGAKIVLGFILAYLFGILFQYFSVAPMRKLGVREGILAAIKIDTLSLLAYEIGMFVVMLGRAWLWPHLSASEWSYWLSMQIAMVVGFCTTYPVNWWLIRQGIKEKM